jgi:hypothetical protein
VTPIADEQAPQSMWLLDAAFLVRTLENIAMLGLAAMLIIALAQARLRHACRAGSLERIPLNVSR